MKLIGEAGARTGILVSAFVLGAILILATWANYRSAREATATLHIGQARLLEREVFGVLRRTPDDADRATMEAALDSLIDEQAEQGLRYVALPDAEGGLAASAGKPFSPTGEADLARSEDGRGFTLTVIGERVRMTLVRPPRPSGPPPDEPPAMEAEGGPPGEPTTMEAEGRPPGHDRGHRFAGMILEFEPLVAARLIDRAERLLGFGLIAALVMMFVASLSWVMSQRYERAKRHLEEERRLSLLGQMSAVLAHEIRNPLASLKGHAQLLTERLEAESPERRKAERVVQEASRIEALTGDLLNFVRSGPLERRPADPVELVRTCIEEVDPQGFAFEIGGAPERWSLDAERMRQAITNLLRNAQQASRAGGPRPTVRLAGGETLSISVRDFGSGLPAGQEGRIFEPFFTTRTSGTGLGLVVARRIVELHHGVLTASDHPEGGAVFEIRIPASDD